MTRRWILVVLCTALLPGCGRMDQPTVREIAFDAAGEDGSADDEMVCPGSGTPGRTRPTIEERRQAKLAGDKTAKKAGRDVASSANPHGSKKNNPHASSTANAHGSKPGDPASPKTSVAAHGPSHGAAKSEKSRESRPSAAAGGKAPSGDGREVRMGGVRLTAPKSWTREQPPIDVILAYFNLPRSKGDPDDAEVTVTPAAIDKGNMEVLREQLKQETDSGTAERLTIGGNEVVLIETTGKNDAEEDAASAPAGEGRFRSLNATVFLDGKVFFINCSGPEKTVGERSGEFRDFLKTMKSVD